MSAEPTDSRPTNPFHEFFRSEAAGGALLVVCACAALAVANSRWAAVYDHVLATTIAIDGAGHLLSLTVHQFRGDAALRALKRGRESQRIIERQGDARGHPRTHDWETTRDYLRRDGRRPTAAGGASRGRHLDGAIWMRVAGRHRIYDVALHCHAGVPGHELARLSEDRDSGRLASSRHHRRERVAPRNSRKPGLESCPSRSCPNRGLADHSRARVTTGRRTNARVIPAIIAV